MIYLCPFLRGSCDQKCPFLKQGYKKIDEFDDTVVTYTCLLSKMAEKIIEIADHNEH